MQHAIQSLAAISGALYPNHGRAAQAGVQRTNLAAESPQAEWVRRAQEGDLRAFEQLFEQYQRGIYNVIFQMVRSDADASDLTQETFLRAWKALPRLDAPEAFTAWIYRIATNLTRNWIRDTRRVRQESLDQPYAGDDEENGQRDLPDYSSDPAGTVQTRATQEAVQRAIEGLSEDHRLVVTLHHIEGVPVDEVARIMHCSVGTVKSRLSRARDHLRRRLLTFVEG